MQQTMKTIVLSGCPKCPERLSKMRIGGIQNVCKIENHCAQRLSKVSECARCTRVLFCWRSAGSCPRMQYPRAPRIPGTPKFMRTVVQNGCPKCPGGCLEWEEWEMKIDMLGGYPKCRSGCPKCAKAVSKMQRSIKSMETVRSIKSI